MRISSLLCLAVLLAAGCATVKEARPSGLAGAASPAWSARATNDAMIVAVSPVRQSVQVLGASLGLVGAGVDAVVNAKYRGRVMEALGDYDAAEVFNQKLEARLNEARPGMVRVPPLQSVAGFQNEREAEAVRRASLAKKGHDTLLDLKMTYGLFGYEGILVAKIDGRLTLLPENKTLWNNDIVVSAEPILASDPLSDPTNRLAPTSPRFTVEEGAMEKWTRDGGQAIRMRFEAAADGAVSALLCDLGLADEPLGHYYLGKLAMNRKKFNLADDHFSKAAAGDPSNVEAQNGRAVNLAHNKQVDDAIRLLETLVKSAPEYGPAWFNLAWFHAVEKKAPASAKPCYERALALGMPPDKKIEKAIGV